MLHKKTADLTFEADNAPAIEAIRADDHLSGWRLMLAWVFIAIGSYLALAVAVWSLYAAVAWLRSVL